MKDFIKYDYYLQLFIFIVGTVVSFIELDRWGFMGFYFIVGGPQLMSFIIKLFLKSKKSVAYLLYGVLIMPVWISLLLLYQFNLNNEMTNVFGCILIVALLYSPMMAILYIYDCYKTYEPYKN